MRLKDRVDDYRRSPRRSGKEIARTFVAEGASVVIADLNQKGADQAALELDNSEKRAIGVAMDVTDETQVEAGMTKAIDRVWSDRYPCKQCWHSDRRPARRIRVCQMEEKLLSIHLDGAFLTTRAALRQMYKQGDWR